MVESRDVASCDEKSDGEDETAGECGVAGDNVPLEHRLRQRASLECMHEMHACKQLECERLRDGDLDMLLVVSMPVVDECDDGHDAAVE